MKWHTGEPKESGRYLVEAEFINKALKIKFKQFQVMRFTPAQVIDEKMKSVGVWMIPHCMKCNQPLWEGFLKVVRWKVIK
jgi:hypothetical protein